MRADIIIGQGFWASIDGPSSAQEDAEEALAYRPKGYVFSPAYKNEQWDGWSSMWSKRYKGFPAGLAEYVEKALQVGGFEVKINDTRRPPEPTVSVFHDQPNVVLEEHQTEAVETALERGRGLVHHAVGAGKSLVLLETVRRLSVPSLALVHTKDLLWQLAKNGQKYLGCEVGIIGDGRWKRGAFTVATFQSIYQRLEASETRQEMQALLDGFDAVLVDECFVGTTNIATPAGQKPISEIQIGEVVLAYDHQRETVVERTVTKVWRRPLDKPLALVLHCGGRASYCSTLDHQVWQEGIGYAKVQQGSYLRILRDQLHRDKGTERQRKNTRIQVVPNVCSKAARRDFINNNGKDQQKMGLEQNARAQPNAQSRSSSQGECAPEGPRMETPNPRGEWEAPTHPTSPPFPCARLADRVRSTDRTTPKRRGPVPLQIGCGESSPEGSNRSGRSFSQHQGEKRGRSKKRALVGLSRVDSVTVFQHGGDEESKRLCPEGYVYDLEVSGAHSYFANGVLVHNCHHIQAKTFETVLRCMDAYYRYGFSATPLKSGDKETMLRVQAWIGPVISRLDSKGGIKAGRLVPADVLMVGTGNLEPCDADYMAAYESGVVKNGGRNGLIVAFAQKLRKRGPVLILVERLEHGLRLARELQCTFLQGNVSGAERDRNWEAMRRGQVDCMVASVIADEGVDIPNISALILAGGGKAPHKIIQRIGRGQRKVAGKQRLFVIDFQDRGAYLGRHARKRQQLYEKEPAYSLELVSKAEAEAMLGPTD